LLGPIDDEGVSILHWWPMMHWVSEVVYT